MGAHTLVVHPDQQRALEELAAAEHRSPEMLVHDALENFIRVRQEQNNIPNFLTPEEEEQFTRDTEASWRHYQETGLHVTHNEVLDWFSRLRKDPHAPPPQCHT